MESLRDNFSTNIGSGCFASNASLFQRRNSSELVRRQLYKTKMCAFYNVGKCTRGNLCAFAHSVQELRPLPDLRFTRLCELTKRGDVCRDVNCTFAHSLNDLRTTEIPPAPLSEFNIMKSAENTTLIRKLGSTNESKAKFRTGESIKDPFLSKSEEEVFVSSTDTTPHSIRQQFGNTEYEVSYQLRKIDNIISQNVGSIRGGIFSYLNEPEASQLDSWVYNEDFGSKFTPDISSSSEASCKFVNQSDFQEPPNYFSSKCLLARGIPDWNFISNDDKTSALQCDILNIIGGDGNLHSGDICSIEKGTLHIIN
ncbi:CCCH domain-containing protein [Cryptosporidium ubiquitum]|uniref:CCCH domain-containing protein n=1 Tax=Cryptosporidium ubiquitum TaxID=857276 RepID=A0A1J4MN27_9CRYT|nr:CCCH domain-containing protein [Cryptosporidium ubiquitum]OII74859.1 CCCH domain-containing protein [Cryptosporidium ubiquitum]